jgi:hypothetical protein
MENDARIENRTLARKTKEKSCSYLNCAGRNREAYFLKERNYENEKKFSKEKCNLFILQI